MYYVRLLGRSPSLSKIMCCSVFVGLELTCALKRWLENFTSRNRVQAFFRRWDRRREAKVGLGKALFSRDVGSREKCNDHCCAFSADFKKPEKKALGPSLVLSIPPSNIRSPISNFL